MFAGECKMFTGKYSHSVDDKGRFIMPLKFRELLDGRCMVTKGLDEHCLYIFDMQEWEAFASRLRALPSTKEAIRKLQRHFIPEAEQVEIDKQGRCLISSELRTYAGIKGEIKLMGMDNKIELWSAENWTKFTENDDFDVSAAADSIDLVI